MWKTLRRLNLSVPSSIVIEIVAQVCVFILCIGFVFHRVMVYKMLFFMAWTHWESQYFIIVVRVSLELITINIPMQMSLKHVTVNLFREACHSFSIFCVLVCAPLVS